MKRAWHRPRAFAVALTLAGVAVFLALAAWQFRRAHEKERLFDALAHASTQGPVSLDAARREASDGNYPVVRVEGRFDPRRQYLLDNVVRGPRTGVMVYGVFEPAEGGPALLVNRGFLAREAATLPEPPSLPASQVAIDAIYAPPPGVGLRMGGNVLPRQAEWPKTVIYIDLGEIAADAARELDARVLLEIGDDARFVRDWTPAVFPPVRHLGYAWTWLTFALVAVATFLILHWRRREPT
ncbi:MAG: SURF1 family protein [Lysobacteraceae bacterium]|nr:MAG: SURF1 family protein [Xanthomonadaceae bacterium]